MISVNSYNRIVNVIITLVIISHYINSKLVYDNHKLFIPVLEDDSTNAACGEILKIEPYSCDKMILSNQTLTKCCMECFIREGCKSFNADGYFTTSFICELFIGRCAIKLIKTQSGCIYYHDQNMPPREMWQQNVHYRSDNEIGWTEVLIQSHDLTVDQSTLYPFNRSWDEYKFGFSCSSGCYWLGNEVIHRMTKTGRCRLLTLLMSAVDKKWFYIQYDPFEIGSEDGNYKLISLKFSTSNMSYDALSGRIGTYFSTFDRDQDSDASQNCAFLYKCGFWFGSYGQPKCGYTNFNAFEPHFVYFYNKVVRLSISEMWLQCLI